MKMFKGFSVFLVSMVICMLVGCATFEENIDTEKLIVQIATMKVIEVGDTAEHRRLRAERIISVTSEARTWLNTDGVNLGELRIKLDDRLSELDLQPSDRILVSMLVDQLIIGLNERVVNDVKMPVPPEEFIYQVNTVLAWVEGAARLY